MLCMASSWDQWSLQTMTNSFLTKCALWKATEWGCSCGFELALQLLLRKEYLDATRKHHVIPLNNSGEGTFFINVILPMAYSALYHKRSPTRWCCWLQFVGVRTIGCSMQSFFFLWISEFEIPILYKSWLGWSSHLMPHNNNYSSSVVVVYPIENNHLEQITIDVTCILLSCSLGYWSSGDEVQRNAA